MCAGAFSQGSVYPHDRRGDHGEDASMAHDRK